MTLRAWRGLLSGIALLVLATSLAAQGRGRFRGEGNYYEPIRQGVPEKRSGFMFCRLQYERAVSFPSGHGWSTDYPRSDRNFMRRVPQITYAGVTRWDDGEIGHAVVRPTDHNLFHCPFIFASDIGTAGFSTEEANGLRAYLLKGGFLWVDDFWGQAAWQHWVGQIQRVLPEYQIHDVTPDHPLWSTFY